MTDLHATAAQLIIDVHDGDILAAGRHLRGLMPFELADLALILAKQAHPDAQLIPQFYGADHAIIQAVKNVALSYGYATEDLTGTTRNQGPTQARQVACWIAHDAGAGFSAIGRVINRDHTTVMHAVRKVQNSHALLAMARTIRDGTRDTGAA